MSLLLLAAPPNARALASLHFPTSGVEVALWILAAVALCPVVVRAFRELAREGELRWLSGVLAIGAVLRLVCAHGPQNWYFGMANAVTDNIYTRKTTYLPLPNRVVIFDLGLGAEGIWGLNLIVGLAGVGLLTYAARRAGHTSRAVHIFSLLLAVTPMYVRYSASDASHTMIFFLYACGAAAYARLATGSGGKAEYGLLVPAVLLAALVRVESAPVLLAMIFLPYHGGKSAREALLRGAPSVVLIAATVAGTAWSASIHGVQGRSIELPQIVLTLLSVITLVPNPWPVWFVSPLLAVPVWIWAVRLARRRRWNDLSSIYLPLTFCAGPFLFHGAIFVNLVATGYAIVGITFVLLGSARALDDLLDRAARREILAKPRQRVLLALGLLPPLLYSFTVPYFFTYSFHEEFRFLHRNLPKEPATILTMFDDGHDFGDIGDFDCCLAMPPPVLYAANAQLKWIVLRRRDLESGGYRGLDFDYYYPGSMVATDPDSPRSWAVVRLAEWLAGRLGIPLDRSETDSQCNHLATMRAFDERIREEYGLSAYRSDAMTARTFSSAGFSGDRMTLTLYRRER